MTAGKVNLMTRIILWSEENIESDKIEVFRLLTNIDHYRNLGFFAIDCHKVFVKLFIGIDSILIGILNRFCNIHCDNLIDVKSKTNRFLNIDL